MSQTLFTIGYSNYKFNEFVHMLEANHVTAIADVRSIPYSRYESPYNQDVLKAELNNHGIAYAFLGQELGARRHEKQCYVNGKAKYSLIERLPIFSEGLSRIRKGSLNYVIALMCAEKDPITCHRTILVSKALKTDFDIIHIIGINQKESHNQLEYRLIDNWKEHIDSDDEYGFDAIEKAYLLQAERIEFKI